MNSKSEKETKSPAAPKVNAVKVFSTSTCPWCMKVKEFLKANNVRYEEFNVGEDQKARNEMFEKSGQIGVPVTEVNGTIIVGYDKEALKKSLNI